MSVVEPYLDALINGDATALHLRGGEPPFWRVGNDLLPNGDPLPTGERFERMLVELLRLASRNEEVSDDDETSFVVDSGEGRFSVHLYRSAEGRTALIRKLAEQLHSLDLGIPHRLRDVAALPSGLVLLAGQPGSGLSTTLTTLIETVNIDSCRYVVHMDQPVPFRVEARQSVVHQIAVGSHAPSFAGALRSAQLKILGQPRYRHPAYWAPFLLIGSWL